VTRDELSALYEKYGYLVHRRCAAILGEPADAEDALQEVFMRVQRYDRGEVKQSPLAWLYSVASNVCFDLHQKRSRAAPTPPEKLERVDPRQTGTGADGDRQAMIGAVLRRVDETVREIGLLCHLDGYTQDEAAQKLGLSRKTIGRKLAEFDQLFQAMWAQANVNRSPT
jgi:RNA polymerase sigma-70 factor (ECF subfamily)